MTLSYLQNQLNVNSVLYSGVYSTRINIKKRRERVLYKTLTSNDNVNIAYVMGNPVTPGNNLFISDKSTSLTQNRVISSPTPTVETTRSFLLSVDKFLVTNQFTTETPTQPETPLFYVHTLENFNESVEGFIDLSLLSIEFADYDFSPISITDYVLDSSTGELFNNIENTYNDTDRSFDLTFIKYTVKNTSTGAINIYHELISNSDVYEQATFDDIDELGYIYTDRRKYIVQALPGLSYYQVTLPTSDTYAYIETPKSRIKILKPTAVDTSSPWHVRISNGQFITSLKVINNTYRNYKYYIAEFNSQTYYPYPPYKQQVEQIATWIYNNIIYVPKNIVNDLNLNLPIDIIIKDHLGAVKYVYTNDETRIGTYYDDTIAYTDGILSIDSKGGFIEVLDKVRTDDVVLVTYYTEEDEYVFSIIDMNPINNLDILNKRLVLYVNPETTYTGELSETLHYLLVNTEGKITYASQPVTGTPDSATTRMLSEDFFSTGIPKHTFYYDTESSISGLNYRASDIYLDYRDELSFVDKYTVDSALLTSTIVSGYYGAQQNTEENPKLLVLGDVYIGENTSVSQLEEFDVRVQGGGIKEDYIDEAVLENADVHWYQDISGKRIYPGVGTFMVEVPQTLLTTYGGRFTRESIEDTIERHMKAGGYGILKTYGVDPVITSATTTSGTITLSWPSYGSSATYNIYWSKFIDKGFTLSNSNVVSDNTSGNNYTVSGLTVSTKYYVKVGGLDENENESFGPIISATTTVS